MPASCIYNYRTISRETFSPAGKEQFYVTSCGADMAKVRELAQDLSFIRDGQYILLDPMPENFGPSMEFWENHLLWLQNVKAVILVLSYPLPDIAEDSEVAFLLKNRIPLLPISLTPLRQMSSQAAWNKWFRNIHVLDREIPDFSDQVSAFFDHFMKEEHLKEKLDTVFCGRIFFSYRKKDLAEAYDLMHILRQIQYCQRMALWYDHSLIGGEDFNEEIRDQIAACDFFLMLVTPHVLEKDNYVRIHEYPKALEENKSIIAIETVPTDREAFSQAFPSVRLFSLAKEDLPDLIWMIRQCCEKALVKHTRRRLAENALSAEEFYYAGQAFLNGVQVEKDVQHAFSLFSKSAEAGYTAAFGELAYLSFMGIGCQADQESSEKFQSAYLEHLQKDYEQSQDVALLRLLVEAALNLADDYIRRGNGRSDLQLAADELEKILPLSLDLAGQGFEGTRTNPGTIHLKLMQIGMDLGNQQMIHAHMGDARKWLERVFYSFPSKVSGTGYGSYLFTMGIYIRQLPPGNPQDMVRKSADYFEQAAEVLGWVVREHHDSFDLADKNLAMWMKEGLEMERFDIEKAREIYMKIRKYALEMNRLRGSNRDRQNLATVLVNLSSAGVEIPDKKMLLEARDLWSGLCRDNPQRQDFRNFLNAVEHRLQVWPKNPG